RSGRLADVEGRARLLAGPGGARNRHPSRPYGLSRRRDHNLAQRSPAQRRRAQDLPRGHTTCHSIPEGRALARRSWRCRHAPSENELQMQVERWMCEADLGVAWEKRVGPIVDFGPREGPMGNSLAGDTRLAPGQLIHVDIGVRRDGFASDLQRTWYWLKDGEK